ncbi:carbohydrate ABC transporter substrate-binding protein, CUT1 family [Halothece sp. PCC 7418]|uniref:ABC transporter substrate-binding protein n=1 Tax=Halothece sp. (strain PCC 7418) TaxID=65093 RepID=UPI0002A08356|nr:ABC transporter substrate-binding protein [Halothece sp. PCC 7418]AFZ42392.1 carbohydrate ABC transporter substrate-binding protein, CUT1 family [Halothece sp. PCC 7418]
MISAIKVSLWIFCVTLTFLLASCTPFNGSPQTDNVTRLTLWHGINPPSNREVFQDLVAQFNQKHENLKIDAIYIGQPDGQLPKILTAVVGEVPPDMLWFVPQLTGQLVELGAIRPLNDWLDQSSVKDEIDPVLLNSMELNNQIWSVPFATNNAAIFYRPSLFAKAGIETPPQTWEELEEAAEKLTKDFDQDGLVDQYGMFLSLGKGEWTVFTWLPFVYSAKGELLTEQKQPNLVNEGTIEALEFGSKLVQNNWATLSAPERGYILDQFLSGGAAMQVTGPWTLGQLSQTDVDYDVFPFPKKKQQSAVVGGENLFVFKTNPEREKACFEFLEYVLSESFQTEWALRTGYLPINLKSQQSEDYQQFVEENPVLKVFLEQMEVAEVRPILANYSRLSENLGRAIEASLLGKKAPEEALKESQRRLELIFQD